MKKTLLIVPFCLMFVIAYGQNTYPWPSSGNIGISTTSPSYPLDVHGEAGFRTNTYFYGTAWAYESSTNSYFGFSTQGGVGRLSMQAGKPLALQPDGGTVGIGTSSPSSDYKLDVNGTSAFRSTTYFFGASWAYESSTDSYLGLYTQGGVGRLLMQAGKPLALQSDGGNVGIGTDQPDAKLTVKGDIHTQEVLVDLQGAVAPDFVFEEDYDLKSLEETEEYIRANKHLPEIPSASEMESNGFELKEMNLKLLQKVEELTLYLIQQNKELKEQKDRVAELERRLESDG